MNQIFNKIHSSLLKEALLHHPVVFTSLCQNPVFVFPSFCELTMGTFPLTASRVCPHRDGFPRASVLHFLLSFEPMNVSLIVSFLGKVSIVEVVFPFSVTFKNTVNHFNAINFLRSHFTIYFFRQCTKAKLAIIASTT